jgi:hypothetical protein
MTGRHQRQQSPFSALDITPGKAQGGFVKLRVVKKSDAL